MCLLLVSPISYLQGLQQLIWLLLDTVQSGLAIAAAFWNTITFACWPFWIFDCYRGDKPLTCSPVQPCIKVLNQGRLQQHIVFIWLPHNTKWRPHRRHFIFLLYLLYHLLCLISFSIHYNNCFIQVFWTLLIIGPISGQQQVGEPIVCPKPDDYFPCKCLDYNDGTAYLFCDRQNMQDAKISQILQAYLATANVSPLSFLQLQYNQLSRVPAEIHLFPALNYVNLEYNNIENVQTGAFNFTALLYQLHLSSNPLLAIQTDAFQGG